MVATTKEYLADALDAVTSDIGGVAQQLTDLLDLQADAINDLDASLASARARLDLAARRTRAGGWRACARPSSLTGIQTDVAGRGRGGGDRAAARAPASGVSGVRTDVPNAPTPTASPRPRYIVASLNEVRADREASRPPCLSDRSSRARACVRAPAPPLTTAPEQVPTGRYAGAATPP